MLRISPSAAGRPGAVAGSRGEALAAAGSTPLAHAEEEGLALINGTGGMLGMLVLAAAAESVTGPLR